MSREPTIADIDRIARQLRAEVVASGDTVPAFGNATAISNDVVLAIGGGSAIDTAKAVAALATNRSALGCGLSGRGRPRTGDREASLAGRRASPRPPEPAARRQKTP